MKQNFAAVVYPTARDFVKYDGKRLVECRMHEFLEVPYTVSRLRAMSRTPPNGASNPFFLRSATLLSVKSGSL